MSPFTFLGQRWETMASLRPTRRTPPSRGFWPLWLGIVLILAGLLASCTPDPGTVPKHVPVEAPPKARRVDLTPAQRSTTEASRGNAQASGSVGRIAAELSAVKLDLGGAVAEADRLRKQKAASERELELLWQNLTDISRRHDLLAKEAEEAKSALAYQTVALRNIEEHLQRAQADVEAKEVEASVLRASLSTAEKLRASTGEALEKANASAAGHAESANKASGENRLWRTAAKLIAAAIGIYLFIRFLLPLILRALKP